MPSRARIDIDIDGARLSPELEAALTSARISQRLSRPSSCELVFAGTRDALRFGDGLRAGAPLRLSTNGPRAAVFDGYITALEYGHGPSRDGRLSIRGHDALQRLAGRQPVRAHVETTIAELAQALSADLGFDVACPDNGPLLHRLTQFRQSDLDLLADAAELCGLYFFAHDRTLELFTLEGSATRVTLTFGESLLEVRTQVNSQYACRSVLAMGWAPTRVEAHTSTAASTRTPRPATVSAAGGERTLAGVAVEDEQQAEALAQAVLDWRAAQEMTLWGVAEGDPLLRPGTRIAVAGISPMGAGSYVLTEAMHIVDAAGGYVTEISTAPPAPRAATAAPLVGWGIVTRVDDPDGQGRVQVKLPAFGDVETSWIPVVSPGAGTGKGLVIIPDVGDHVLLLSLQGNPAQSIVVGGLYGAHRLPGEHRASPHVFSLTSQSGHSITLDDERRFVRVQNADGSCIEMKNGAMSLHASGDLTIEAPGRTITIRGNQIDFVQG
jgi:phage baseplate assembly protein V